MGSEPSENTRARSRNPRRFLYQDKSQDVGMNGQVMRLAVLNPGGRDCRAGFSRFCRQSPDAAAPHPPVNYHAYAACTGGSFHREVE